MQDPIELTYETQPKLVDHLVRHSPYIDNSRTSGFVSEFFAFHRRTGRYSRDTQVWRATTNATSFWHFIRNEGSELAPVALRIFSCMANSVPSKRAFSIMNFIHNRYRNRLTAANVQKLVFYYMNTRPSSGDGRQFLSVLEDDEIEAIVMQSAIEGISLEK